jgi:outer membrane protein insertion porin family
MMARLLVLIFFLLVYPVWGWSALIINDVKIDCGGGRACTVQRERFKTLADTYRNITHLRQTLKVLVSAGGVKDFSWELSGEEGPQSISIKFKSKLVISAVIIKSDDALIQEYVERNTRLKTGVWHEQGLLIDESLRLRQYLSSKGYPRAEINFKERVRGDEVLITVMVIPGKAQLLSEIVVRTESSVIRGFAERKFLDIVGKNFDIQTARAKADELEAELFSYGYYLVSIALTPKKVGENVVVEALIGPVEQWTFDLKRPPLPTEDIKLEFGPIVREMFKRYRRPVDEGSLRVGIQEFYRKQGYLNALVKLVMSRYRNSLGDWVNAGAVEISPGVRTRVRDVSFPGALLWDEKKLQKMWDDQSLELSKAGFYDEESQNAFSDWLRGQYIRLGYVRAEVPPPRALFSGENGTENARLEYTITEGPRVFVDEIRVSGVDDAETVEIMEGIETKEGAPFNPLQFTLDLKKIADDLQDNGWYQAEVVNRDADNIVLYGKDRSSVRLTINIRKGKMITFNRLVIVGNRDTRNNVIRRKSPFTRGMPITPTKVREFENALSSTGLFTSVKARPIIHKGDTPLSDVVIEVVERDYGLIEIAPGYRTDIGLKLSGTVSYLNIFGENISTSLTGQVNQRLDYTAFDPRRRKEGKSLMEYNLTSQFNIPDVEETAIDYGLTLSMQRRRFFSFDADIRRLANTISRDFGSRFSVSLRHQFESINQFDATEKRDNGSFEIGALTPSFTADFRNTRINPTAGAWFNISNEFANPLFFSQKKDDLTINFYKLISRNRFYVPIPRGTIAISAVGGLQENLAKNYRTDGNGNPVLDPETGQRLTEGYIPNIKVFRLTGLDIVRGFSDEEINRLPNGNDIGDDPVQNKAYMANLKIEPRYFINDSLMAGVFYDAGRVYVDTVDIGDLRQSVGVTFKVVTPVGTLDFDYGIKLLRKKDQSGNLEAPGRFHVSIGFF